MRDPQWFFVFSALLATAVSLECEVCKGIGGSCTGKTKTCKAGQDTCVTTIFENSFGRGAHTNGKSVQFVAKGCESSEVCSSPPINMNLGEGKFLRLSSTCCKEGTCTHVSPKMAPEDTQTNGKQCPACYNTKGTCGKEKVDCTGSDMYCFDFTLGLPTKTPGHRSCCIATREFLHRVFPRYSLIAMQLFLGLFSSSILLTTGASLECETCFDLSRHCHGPWLPCGAGQGTCAVSHTEISVGMTLHTTKKGCGSFTVCDAEPFSVNMGQGRLLRGNSACCVGEACKSASPKLPPIVTRPNGKKCPACYTTTSHCPAEVVDCTGSEDHCIERAREHMVVILTSTLSSFWAAMTVTSTFKGCTTAFVCSQITAGSLSLGGMNMEVLDSKCEPAGETSRAPPSTGSSLLALSGLLLMKMLF
ncbi:hypothetical protein lerEdw1_009589 [Lerista edwardsae]|nr:hypothetical protein lerEdw1_009589 [Lerista edwardsae]